MKKGKPKRQTFDWPFSESAKPHVKNWFRSLDTKKLKGAAREKKLATLVKIVGGGQP